MDPEDLEEGEVLAPETETPEGEQTPPEAPAPASEAAPAEGEEEPKREPWFTKRIGVLTAEKQAERQAREQLQRENEALKALLEGKPAPNPSEADPEAPRAPKSPTQQTQADFEKAVEAAAAQKLAIERFNAECDKVWNKGQETFPGKFDAAVANLRAAGAIRADSTDFVQAVLATEAPEQVLFKLGSEPEEAMRLASLPPTQMAVAMDRMARELTSAPVKTSAAPAPIAPVNGTRTAKAFDPADKDIPYPEWLRQREKQVAAKKAAGR